MSGQAGPSVKEIRQAVFHLSSKVRSGAAGHSHPEVTPDTLAGCWRCMEAISACTCPCCLSAGCPTGAQPLWDSVRPLAACSRGAKMSLGLERSRFCHAEVPCCGVTPHKHWCYVTCRSCARCAASGITIKPIKLTASSASDMAHHLGCWSLEGCQQVRPPLLLLPPWQLPQHSISLPACLPAGTLAIVFRKAERSAANPCNDIQLAQSRCQEHDVLPTSCWQRVCRPAGHAWTQL